MRLVLPLAILCLAAAPPPPTETMVSVSLSDFRFAPASVRIEHGRPIVLRLTNNSERGHNFVAREFFAAAAIDASGQRLVRRGKVEVPSHGTIELRLVAPAAGHYRLTCTHFTHAMRGMKGKIVVS